MPPTPRKARIPNKIDPTYGEELRRATGAGVEVLAYRADVGPEEFRVVERVEVKL